MNLETQNKKIELKYRTRTIVKVSNLLQEKNFEELYFKAMSESDLDALSKIIWIFAEDENGEKAFNSSEEVFDFLEDLKQEQELSYEEIFVTIAEDINEQGFFKKKLSKKDLAEKMKNYIALDMNEVIKKSTEKAISQVAEKEFAGIVRG